MNHTRVVEVLEGSEEGLDKPRRTFLPQHVPTSRDGLLVDLLEQITAVHILL